MPIKDKIRYNEYQRQYRKTDKFKKYQAEYNKAHKEKIRNNNKLHRQNNKEWWKNYMKQYRKTDKNKEYQKKYLKEYRVKNKDNICIYMKEYTKQYRKTEKYKLRTNAYLRIYSLRRYNHIIAIDDKTINHKSLINMLKYQNYKCNYCGCDLNKNKKHLDHIMPISRNGIHSIFNVQRLCSKCNLKKSNKLPIGQLNLFA